MDWAGELNQLGTVVLAGALGAIVGLERELWNKPAGLRTHMLVSGGSALLVLLADAIVLQYGEEHREQISADPVRVIQAIVVGISFLGAGTIIHQRGQHIEGLTTAASILVTAGIGIAVAAHLVILAAGTALFALTVLWIVGWLERRISNRDPGRPQQVDSGDATP